MPANWTLTGITGSPATVSAGDACGEITVTVANAYQPGSPTCITIYGYKWDDYSHDGEWDGFEPPLDGWTINLAGPESGTAVTGTGDWPDGYYEFRVCTSEIYTVSEELLPGEWHQTSDPDTYMFSVDVENGPYGPYNFGNAQTCTIIYGYKWDDRNRDGDWDKPDEPPLEDWEIRLDGPVTGVTYTNADGYYEFTICDLPEDTFTVSEVVPGGWTQSYPSAPDTYMFSVDVRNPPYGAYNFGNWKPRPPPPPRYVGAVGGETYPIDKLGILAPWMGLAMLLIGSITWFTLRRRRA